MNEQSLFMTVDELAIVLRLNRDTAYRAVSEKQVPGVRRIGRTIRIHRPSLMDWIEGNGPSSRKREQPK